MRGRTAIAQQTKQPEEELIEAERSTQNNHRPDNAGSHGENDTPPLEWAVACLGLVLVVAVLGLLLYKAIWTESSPPQVTIRVISTVPVQNGFLVQFEAVNHGGSTAEGVVVAGELKRGTEQVETSHTTLDYLPPNSTKSGGLFFTHDPRQFEFHARAFGYEEP